MAYRLWFASTDAVLNGLYTRYSTAQSDGMDQLHRKMAVVIQLYKFGMKCSVLRLHVRPAVISSSILTHGLYQFASILPFGMVVKKQTIRLIHKRLPTWGPFRYVSIRTLWLLCISSIRIDCLFNFQLLVTQIKRSLHLTEYKSIRVNQ